MDAFSNSKRAELNKQHDRYGQINVDYCTVLHSTRLAACGCMPGEWGMEGVTGATRPMPPSPGPLSKGVKPRPRHLDLPVPTVAPSTIKRPVPLWIRNPVDVAKRTEPSLESGARQLVSQGEAAHLSGAGAAAEGPSKNKFPALLRLNVRPRAFEVDGQCFELLRTLVKHAVRLKPFKHIGRNLCLQNVPRMPRPFPRRSGRATL